MFVSKGAAIPGVFGPLDSCSKESTAFLMVAKSNLNSQQEEKYNSECSLCTFDSRKLVGYTQKNQKMLQYWIVLNKLCVSPSAAASV